MLELEQAGGAWEGAIEGPEVLFEFRLFYNLHILLGMVFLSD